MRRSDSITARRTGGSSFPAWIPKPLKRQSRSAHVVPTHIRVSGARLNKDTRAYMRDKLSRALGKFARSIERITVRVMDVNGPRGGIDQVCRIKVVLINQPGVLVEARNAFADAAFRNALARIERAVRRSVQRRRVRPRRSRPRSRRGAA